MNAPGIWVELAGALAAAAVLPFYMGYAHMSLAELLLYATAAGIAISSAEHVQFGVRGMTVAEFFGDLKLGIQLVLALGLPTYLTALIAV